MGPSTLRHLVKNPMPNEFKDIKPPGVHAKCSHLIKALGEPSGPLTEGFPIHPSWFRESVPLARSGFNYMWSVGLNTIHWDEWHQAADRARELRKAERQHESLAAEGIAYIFAGKT